MVCRYTANVAEAAASASTLADCCQRSLRSVISRVLIPPLPFASVRALTLPDETARFPRSS